MDLYYEAYGSGHPLIILHGLFGSADNWHSVCVKLAANLKVFALDQRNHGRSPHSFDMDYGIMAEDVRGFLDSQRLPEAFVLGHSMGGKTAMQLALLYPQLVKKLVVLDISPRQYSPRHREILEGMLALDLSGFQTRQQLEAALAAAVPERSTRQFLLKNVVRQDSGGFHWRLGLQELRQNYPRLTGPIASERPFNKPTLFIRGKQSDYLRETELPALQQLFPRATLQSIAGAGHLVHVEQPEAFVQAVRDFLLPAR